MKTNAKATFSTKHWDEKTWDGKPASEVDGNKLSRAQVENMYDGDLKGHSELQYLMTYRGDGTGNFVGVERIEGSLKGRTGSFVVEHNGTFDAEGVKGTLTVVPGSGTGELKTLRGEGSYDLKGQHEAYPILFDVEFD